MGLGEEANIDAMLEDALDEADEDTLLAHIAKLEDQNKRLEEQNKRLDDMLKSMACENQGIIFENSKIVAKNKKLVDALSEYQYAMNKAYTKPGESKSPFVECYIFAEQVKVRIFQIFIMLVIMTCLASFFISFTTPTGPLAHLILVGALKLLDGAHHALGR